MDSIILTEKQQIHSDKMIDILLKYNKAIDTTKPGGGKSLIVIWLIFKLKIKNPIMICPSFMVETWKRYNLKYNVGFLAILSYEMLRGTSINESEDSDISLCHRFLTRNGNSYKTTKYFRKLLIRKGCTVFFDEFQKLKNENRMQRFAAEAICTEINNVRKEYEDAPYSAYYFFSATPFDKKIHCITLCKTMNIISNIELLSAKNRKKSSIYELKEYCLELDEEKTLEIWGKYALNPKTVINLAFELCIKIVFPKITSFVYSDILINGNQTIYYTHEELPEIGMNLLDAAECMIHSTNFNITDEMENTYRKIVKADEESDNILESRNGITHGQITSETIKTYYIISKLAKKALEEVENSKVVIFLNYKEPIKVAKRKLERYGVIVLTGVTSLSKEHREELISEFQKPNLQYRILIVICQVGSVGLEFDDKHGGFPRICFMNLGHSAENIIQSAGRTDREQTKSKSLFFLIKVTNREEAVDKNIKEKSEILKLTLKNNGIIPPIDFLNISNLREYNFLDLLETAGTLTYGNTFEEPEEEKIIIKAKSSIKSWFD